MINISREVKAKDMREELESLTASTTATNRFIQLLDGTIRRVSLIRPTPNQIREMNRELILTYLKRQRR